MKRCIRRGNEQPKLKIENEKFKTLYRSAILNNYSLFLIFNLSFVIILCYTSLSLERHYSDLQNDRYIGCISNLYRFYPSDNKSFYDQRDERYLPDNSSYNFHRHPALDYIWLEHHGSYSYHCKHHNLFDGRDPPHNEKDLQRRP